MECLKTFAQKLRNAFIFFCRTGVLNMRAKLARAHGACKHAVSCPSSQRGGSCRGCCKLRLPCSVQHALACDMDGRRACESTMTACNATSVCDSGWTLGLNRTRNAVRMFIYARCSRFCAQSG